ncbi:MAG: hypothetical protein LBI08_00315 [Methanomassiliicoccaceae archaeon]|nr:hypothetical protein [Methanomassiliicoccaceae archaeon]
MEKKDRKKILAAAVLSAVIVGIVVVTLFVGSVSVSMDDDKLNVSAPMMKRSVDYDDIVKVELRSDIIIGSRANGLGNVKINSGNFKNVEFGHYDLAGYNDVRVYVVVTPVSGKVLVFNLDTVDKTVNAYNELILRI